LDERAVGESCGHKINRLDEHFTGRDETWKKYVFGTTFGNHFDYDASSLGG
jgi:hypothetical protein